MSFRIEISNEYQLYALIEQMTSIKTIICSTIDVTGNTPEFYYERYKEFDELLNDLQMKIMQNTKHHEP